MAAIRRPLWYPPTVMDKEANAILAIRTRVRPAVGGGSPNKWVTPVPASAGTPISGSATINGGSFALRGDKKNFA